MAISKIANILNDRADLSPHFMGPFIRSLKILAQGAQRRAMRAPVRSRRFL